MKYASQEFATGHEEAFINAFIVKDKRDRYFQLISSPKRRHAFLDRLNHQLDFDPSYSILVPPPDQTVDGVEGILRKRGAPELCHTISGHRAWDAKEMPLRDALEMVVGFNIGTVLCCIPGKLAYYEAEDICHRYIFTC